MGELTVVSLIETEAVAVVSPESDERVSVISEVGPPGPAGDAGGAFLVAGRFSELDTPQAKTEARENLELQAIDCGVFL